MNPFKVVPLACLITLTLFMFETNPVKASENSWVTKSNVPLAGVYRAVGLNGRVYVITNSANYEYNPSTDSWATKKAMLTPRHSFGIAACENTIYVIGGSLNGSWAQTD